MMDFEVTYFNDGKEKWQSHKSMLRLKSHNCDVCDIDVDGYGENKEASYNDMIINLEKLSDNLIDAIRLIKSGVTIYSK